MFIYFTFLSHTFSDLQVTDVLILTSINNVSSLMSPCRLVFKCIGCKGIIYFEVGKAKYSFPSNCLSLWELECRFHGGACGISVAICMHIATTTAGEYWVAHASFEVSRHPAVIQTYIHGSWFWDYFMDSCPNAWQPPTCYTTSNCCSITTGSASGDRFVNSNSCILGSFTHLIYIGQIGEGQASVKYTPLS